MCGCCLTAANIVGVCSETCGSLECRTSILPSSRGRKEGRKGATEEESQGGKQEVNASLAAAATEEMFDQNW